MGDRDLLKPLLERKGSVHCGCVLTPPPPRGPPPCPLPHLPPSNLQEPCLWETVTS
jgi:hypothetical protein